MIITRRDIEHLMDKNVPYSRMAEKLGTTKANIARLVTQVKYERAKTFGGVETEVIRKRYLDDCEHVHVIAADIGVSVISLRLFLQAKHFFRDRGAIYRAGTAPKHNKGVRTPGSRRDLAESAADFGSLEHRDKQAAAKRGKRGAETNNWKGGHEIGGYAGAGGGSFKTYVHREIAERLLGRKLNRDEHVHHCDKNRKNNEPMNLLVLHTSIHTKLHTAMRKLDLNPDGQRAWLLENDHPFEDLNSCPRS